MSIKLLVALVVLATTATATHYCVPKVNGKFSVVVNEPSNPQPICEGAVLQGEYNTTLLTIGWDVMRVVTSSDYSDSDQAYAAGYFEGMHTYEMSMNMYNNQLRDQKLSDDLKNFLTANANFMAGQCQAGSLDRYWVQACLMWDQFNGMLDGLNEAAVKLGATNVTQLQLMLLVSQGDLLDLTLAFPTEEQKNQNDWRKMNSSAFELFIAKKTHCSALIKVSPTLDNIFYGHATWQSFTFALRIFKIFTLNFKSTEAKTMEFSSYPATISSTDDFYVTNSGLVVIETSLNVFNTSIYENNMSPKLLLSWMRVMIANRIATNGSDWYNIFSTLNSGTYNNQWMVLDLNKFTPNTSIQPNTLWIVEQMPGKVQGADMSTILQYGYWPSYNIPSFKDMFDYAGYPQAIKNQGPHMLDYQSNVRAQQFRMVSPTVTSIEDMKNMMQYNQFMTDGISQNNPGWAIASRFDLTPSYIGPAQTFGAIDAKLSDYTHFRAGMQVFAYSGPTPQQKEFSWATTKATAPTPHVGVPAAFNFTWELMHPGN